MQRSLGVVAWVTWTALIVRIVAPWGDLQDHVHWGKVGWIPFVDGPVKFTDIIGNVLLYVPFGFGAGRLTGARQPWAGLALAAVLSGATEATQLYSHWRFPSATDVTSNLLGTLVGLYLAAQTSNRLSTAVPQEFSS